MWRALAARTRVPLQWVGSPGEPVEAVVLPGRSCVLVASLVGVGTTYNIIWYLCPCSGVRSRCEKPACGGGDAYRPATKPRTATQQCAIDNSEIARNCTVQNNTHGLRVTVCSDKSMPYAFHEAQDTKGRPKKTYNHFGFCSPRVGAAGADHKHFTGLTGRCGARLATESTAWRVVSPPWL